MSEHVKTVDISETAKTADQVSCDISTICSYFVMQMQVRRVTYRDIAEEIGVSMNELILAFSDHRKMSLCMLADICDFLGLDIEFKLAKHSKSSDPIEYSLGA